MFGGVDAEKALGGANRLEALHFALSPSHRLMRIFGSIVLSQPLLMRAGQLRRCRRLAHGLFLFLPGWLRRLGTESSPDSLLEGNGFEPLVPREIGVRAGLASCGFTWAYSAPAARRPWPSSLGRLKSITNILPGARSAFW